MTLEVGFPALTREEIVTSIRTAKKHLIKYFKTINVKLGDLQRHIRGKISLPMGGVPDVMAAMMSDRQKNGVYKTSAGESYIQLVVYNKDGIESIRTINAFGASNKPDSPHYTDQMEMFVNQQTKEMTFDEKKIRAEAEKIYSPE